MDNNTNAIARNGPKRLERERRAHYSCTNYIRYSDYSLRQRETFNTLDPIFSTSTGKKCAKCEKIGYFAKCCRPNKRINRIQEHGTSSAEEDDWSPNTIHSINQKIDPTRLIKKVGLEFFTLTAFYNRPIKFNDRQWTTGNLNAEVTT